MKWTNEHLFVSSIDDNSLKLALQIWQQKQSLGDKACCCCYFLVCTGSGWQTCGIHNVKSELWSGISHGF